MGAKDDTPLDVVSSIPDSGTCMAVGYARGKGFLSGLPWSNITPHGPAVLLLSAKARETCGQMKLIPNYSIIKNKRVAFATIR